MNSSGQAVLAGPSYDAIRAPTRRERFLADMEGAMPWGELRMAIDPVFSLPGNPHGHRLELDRLLRVYFLQRWFRLSDTAVREELYDSMAMRAFACVGLGRDTVPTETAISWFRRSLQEFGLAEVIVDASAKHLKASGLAVAAGTIIDATLFETRAANSAGWHVPAA